ncbi:hypothetical protein NPIL_63551 [Nephila pilipes]|uniref:Uncharacterized protein n=1 Tax=Nephila pilipes TaxID=299642 RepID=A0A8X6PDQ0_NEPPI|nr:hypothetical protein NPIL_63551 [Nephila pilipes]
MGPTESCDISKCLSRMAESNDTTNFKIGPIGRTLGLPKPKRALFYVFASQNSPNGGNYTILVQGDAAPHFLSVLLDASRSEPWFQFEDQNQGNMETGVSSGFVSQQWG